MVPNITYKAAPSVHSGTDPAATVREKPCSPTTLRC
jgi:hypothetical protein